MQYKAKVDSKIFFAVAFVSDLTHHVQVSFEATFLLERPKYQDQNGVELSAFAQFSAFKI